MSPDLKQVEAIVEIVTREVLTAMAEHESRQNMPPGVTANSNARTACAFSTCMDNVGQVVSAGAERLTSSLGAAPVDPTSRR